MHPVSYLFEDVYKNDWGIASAATSEKRRGKASPWKREPRFIVGRKRAAKLDRFNWRKSAMHPISHLFQDIYRNYWGISPAVDRPERQRAAEPVTRRRKLRLVRR